MAKNKARKKILLFGGTGRLGSELIRQYRSALEIDAPSRIDCDITNKSDVLHYASFSKPDIIINSAALVGASECENNKTKAWLINVTAAENIARAAQQNHCRLIFISSSAVFDGNKGLYKESDPPTPTFYYAVTKVAAEQNALMAFNYATVRLDFFVPYSPLKYSTVLTDHYTSKCTVQEAAERIKTIALSDFTGIMNIGNRRQSLYEILKPYYPEIRPIRLAESALPSYPRDISLDLSLWNSRFGS